MRHRLVWVGKDSSSLSISHVTFRIHTIPLISPLEICILWSNVLSFNSGTAQEVPHEVG